MMRVITVAEGLCGFERVDELDGQDLSGPVRHPVDPARPCCLPPTSADPRQGFHIQYLCKSHSIL